MPSKTYDISRQLFQWLIAYDTTIAEMAAEFTNGDEDKIIAWMNGKRVYRNVLDSIAKYFRTTTENFYGKSLRITRRKKCGVEKVLEILNRDGGDYMSSDDNYQKTQEHTSTIPHKKGCHNQSIGYDELVSPLRKRDNYDS